jgi:hypothetical protein
MAAHRVALLTENGENLELGQLDGFNKDEVVKEHGGVCTLLVCSSVGALVLCSGRATENRGVRSGGRGNSLGLGRRRETGASGWC